VSRHRRYSDWLLAAELRLTKRRDQLTRLCAVMGVLIALVETCLPWERLTPSIPWWAHIAAAVVALPTVYLLAQGDYRAKQQAFAHAMNDLGRRLLFLDSIWESEHTELQERYETSVLRPTQRALEQMGPAQQHKSLRHRVDWYFRTLPTSTHEADRLGLLGILHPRVALGWIMSGVLAALLLPGVALISLAGNNGLSVLVLLLPVYMVYARFSTRFAFELALYDWLRLG
jgi:hypothetical protein